ncbi:FRG domain-containing protein [Massilia sp. TW-1]|uniref:FRG domain-containing protein n=1 Tax=Telluria antibiotica TaxID=2717319 RepID=A0ABX0PJF5_9BURK|nr:FRG domain-containing protein [Telluria antibiotica]NIA56110.1 FRG domain-containing protein [Telluria antibiotica]
MIQVEEVTKLHELLRHIEISLEAADGPRWFRGSGDFEHELLPSLLRHPEVKNGKIRALDLEARVNARFAQVSPPFLTLNGSLTEFDKMFVAQHYGVPTRLLDWSENPFIALYFALSTSKPDKQACVWVLDPLLWTKESLNNPMLPRIPDPVDNAAIRFLESLADQLAPRNDPIAIFANYTNARVVAQRGTFTIFGQGTTPMEKIPYAKKCLKCYVIDPSVRLELHKKILSIGYTHSVIYPDLSGLGTELKTSFGF